MTNLPQNPKSNQIASSYHKVPRTVIKWVNGEPVPYTDFVVPKAKMENVLTAALSLPYDGIPDPFNPGEKILEPEFEGLTNIEVMAIKAAQKAAAGDLESAKWLFDRVLGKAKQSIEQTTVQMSLKDYLETLDLEDKAKAWEKRTVDVKAEKPKPDWRDEI